MTQVGQALLTRIRNEGPIPFEIFMQTALYSEHGFFSTGPVRSSATGDFLTSPEVSPWFGTTIARFLRSFQPKTIVEVGAGTGSLLRSLLAGFGEVDAWAVEASSTARAALLDVLSEDRIVEALGGVPDGFSGALIANELVDNLPVALAVRKGDGWVEHFVGVEDDELVFVENSPRRDVVKWVERFGGEVPDGGVVEVQLQATEWLGQVLRRMSSGVIVLIDYGGTVEELEPRRNIGTLRTYRGHHLGPDPLLEPGATDITVDVNFTALQAFATDWAHTVGLHRQDDFLAAHGLRQVVSDLRQRELAHARAGETMQQLEVKSERIAAETLLHPRGLGDFRVLTIEL
jgi:SAM-dependent MidA family methyltransferase